MFTLGAAATCALVRRARFSVSDNVAPGSADDLRAGVVDMSDGETAVAVSSIADLALEVWRLGRRIASASSVSERIEDSFVRLSRSLEEMNVEVRDPTGERYVEGMNADVVDMPHGSGDTSQTLVISEALRPAIYLNGTCVSVPQIMVEQMKEEGG